MNQQADTVTSYKEVKIGKTIYRVTSFFRAKRNLEKLWSNWQYDALCLRFLHLPVVPFIQLHRKTILLAQPYPCTAMDSSVRYSCRITPVEPSRRMKYGIWIVRR